MTVPIRGRFTLELSCPTTGGKYLTRLSVISTQEILLETQIQIMQSINEQARQRQNSNEFLNELRKICAKHQLVLIA